MKYNATLLYAENDLKLLTQYKKFFDSIFQKVWSAEDGEKAYELYEKHRPNILVLDINMPKLDGLSLASKIREYDSSTKIIILSAYSNKENLMTAIPLLLIDFLVKPVKTESLLATLDRAVLQLGLGKKVKINTNYTYDVINHILYEKETKEIALTKNEIKLLEFCVLNQKKQIFASDEISNFVWDDLHYSMTRLRSLINRFHQKLQSKILVSYYGLGYKIAQ